MLTFNANKIETKVIVYDLAINTAVCGATYIALSTRALSFSYFS